MVIIVFDEEILTIIQSMKNLTKVVLKMPLDLVMVCIGERKINRLQDH